MWIEVGAVVAYLPRKSMASVVGVAAKQYTYLGFRIMPGVDGNSSTAVYEDDGTSTAYLSGNAHVWTTCSVTTGTAAASTTIAIASHPSGPEPYASFPKARTYQLRLPNRGPPASVEVNGVNVPFVRWGAVRASRQTPPASQWYYAFEEDEGVGPVIDLVDIGTSAAALVTVTWREDAKPIDAALDQGVYGTLIRAIYAHANQDTDRTNPDENTPGPAYLSQLSAVGVALEKIADPVSAVGFTKMLARVPTLLANATAELMKLKLDNGRRNYTLALLQ